MIPDLFGHGLAPRFPLRGVFVVRLVVESSDPKAAAILLVVTASPEIHLPHNPTCAVFYYQRTQTANEFNARAVTFGSLVELTNIVACESSLCRGVLSVPRESIPRI